MHIDSGDYQPMEKFGLRWRWDKLHCPEMSEQDRSRIRPLTSLKAEEVWRESQQLYHVVNDVVRPNATAIAQLNTAQKESVEVRDWLDAAIPATEEAIYVSWGSNTSVETDRATFVTWWDTFCYPASDDVLIRPVSSTWAAFYWHEEVLYVGTSPTGS